MMVLVSGIGYSNLSDMSFGRVLYEKMAGMSWPQHVHVEDLNFGPVMIYQWLEESPVKYDKLILVASRHSLTSPAVNREIERAIVQEDERKALKAEGKSATGTWTSSSR